MLLPAAVPTPRILARLAAWLQTPHYGLAFLRAWALFAVPALVVAWLVADRPPEFGILQGHYLPLARWLTGHGERVLLTYPLWGYPAVLAILPLRVIVLLQALLGAGTLAAVWLRLRPLVPWTGLLLASFIGAVPWYALCAGLWPMAPALCLGIVAVLALEHAMIENRLLWAMLGGVLLGLGLNFRSELLPWAIGLPLAVAVARLVTRAEVFRVRIAVAWAAVAVLLLLPWALFYRAQTGHPSLTSSNGGMVAYIALGQLPDNPWHIVHDDSFASASMRAWHLDLDPLSDAGDRTFRAALRQAITAEPWAFARKMAHNARNIGLGGYYVGELATAAQDDISLDVFREHCKLAIGLNPNLTEIAHYRQTGAWDAGGLAVRAVVALVWQALGVGLGSLHLLLIFAGLVLAVRFWTRQPLLVLLAAVVVLQVAIVAAIQYQPRHVDVLYVVGAPFMVLAGERIRQAWLRRRGAQG